MSSVQNDIAKNVTEALEGMSGDTGYHFDWRQVYRGVAPETPEVPSAIVLSGTEEQSEGASDVHFRTFGIEIHGIHETPYTMSDNPDEVALFMIADIQRAVKVDERRGGNAINTRLLNSSALTQYPTEEQVVVIVLLEVDYRTDLSDPAKAR